MIVQHVCSFLDVQGPVFSNVSESSVCIFMISFEYFGCSRVKVKHNGLRSSLTFPLALEIIVMRTFDFSDSDNVSSLQSFKR